MGAVAVEAAGAAAVEAAGAGAAPIMMPMSCQTDDRRAMIRSRMQFTASVSFTKHTYMSPRLRITAISGAWTRRYYCSACAPDW